MLSIRATIISFQVFVLFGSICVRRQRRQGLEKVFDPSISNRIERLEAM